MKKLISILVAFAMMATLCVCMAFAAPANQSTDLEKSVITKVFNVPDGVSAPAASFDFTITPTAQPSSMNLEAKTETIAFPAGTGKQTRVLSLADFIGYNDETKDFNITQPGEYDFTVAEVSGTAAGVTTAPATGSYYLQDDDTKTTENVSFDGQNYKLRLYVTRNEDTGALETQAITVVPSNNDTDTAKVDPEDQDPDNDPDAETPDDDDDAETKVGSDFKFENIYTKSIDDTAENGGAFNVGKVVTGMGDTQAEFPFTVSITIPETYLVNGEYTLTDSKGNTWNFGAGEDLTQTKSQIKLKDTEKLIFTKFPAGATVTITEDLQGSGIQNAALYTGKAEGLATGTYTAGNDLSVATNPVNAKGAVTVTNDLDADDITPTGILINNLPYIALALVAIGGLVAYVVVRRRQDDEA